MLPPATKKGPEAADNQKKGRLPRSSPRGAGGLSSSPAEEAEQPWMARRSEEGHRALRVLAQGQKEKEMTQPTF